MSPLDAPRPTRLAFAILLGVAIVTLAFVVQNKEAPLEGVPSWQHDADDHYRQWPKLGQMALSGMVAALIWSPLAIFGRIGRWRALAFVIGTWVTAQLLFAIPASIEIYRCNLYEFTGFETFVWYWTGAMTRVRTPGVTFDAVGLIFWWNAILLAEGRTRSWVPRGLRLLRHPSAIAGILLLALHWSYAWGPLSFIWMDKVWIGTLPTDLEPAEQAHARGDFEVWFGAMSIPDRCSWFEKATRYHHYPHDDVPLPELAAAMAEHLGRNAEGTLDYLLANSDCYPRRFLEQANVLVALRIHGRLDFENDPRVMTRLEESVVHFKPGWYREAMESSRLRVLGHPVPDPGGETLAPEQTLE